MEVSSTGTVGRGGIVVIGAGGIGGWLLQCLDRTLPAGTKVIVYDQDRLEERNLDRQLFSSRDVGQFKVRAMARRMSRIEIVPVAFWFDSNVELDDGTTLFCCADNHRARFAARNVANQVHGMLFVGANEYTDAEAYVYSPEFRGTKLDMLSFYPEIATDMSGSPTEHCTGQVLDSKPQLAISNMLAASYMTWLHWFWMVELPKMKEFPIGECPIKVSGNFSRITTTKGKDLLE